MSMKRLMIATSVLALSLGGVAFAQTGTSGTMGPSSSDSATHGQANMSESQGNTRESASNIKQAQQALKDQGLYRGEVDGKWGPETKQAVSEFQRKNGLKQTAELDDQTMDQLQHADNDSNQNSGSASENSQNNESGSAAGQNASPNRQNEAR